MKRNLYQMSPYTHVLGRIGRLQTLMTMPVEAGASIEWNYEGTIRLSQLRRHITQDCKVDMYAFFVPHRQIYGDQWKNYISKGSDEVETLSGYTVPDTIPVNCLATPLLHGNVPRWLLAGYPRIWNHYFRRPTWENELPDNFWTTNTGSTHPTEDNINERDYGVKIAHLKKMESSGLNMPAPQTQGRVPTGAGYMELTLYKNIKSQFEDYLQREIKGDRYKEVMRHTYDAIVSDDVENRPYLLGRNSFWLSGYDVDGTAGADLGSYTGKAGANFRWILPRTFLAEHGCVWVMCALRFPPVFEKETHYLKQFVNPHYSQIMGDPKLVEGSGLIEHKIADFFANSTNQTYIGTYANSEWYRHQPNYVHHQLGHAASGLEGWPYIDFEPTSLEHLHKAHDTVYDDMFQSLVFQHWQINSLFNINKYSIIPTPEKTMFSAVNG